MFTKLSKDGDMSNLANPTICKLTTNSRNPVPLLDVDPADAFINCRIRIKFWIFEIPPFGRCAIPPRLVYVSSRVQTGLNQGY